VRSDAIEAAALAAALAESALEVRERGTQGGAVGVHSIVPLYGFDDLCDPDFGSDDDFDNPHGDWLDFG
jgi:hypothetical protein